MPGDLYRCYELLIERLVRYTLRSQSVNHQRSHGGGYLLCLSYIEVIHNQAATRFKGHRISFTHLVKILAAVSLPMLGVDHGDKAIVSDAHRNIGHIAHIITTLIVLIIKINHLAIQFKSENRPSILCEL